MHGCYLDLILTNILWKKFGDHPGIWTLMGYFTILNITANNLSITEILCFRTRLLFIGTYWNIKGEIIWFIILRCSFFQIKPEVAEPARTVGQARLAMSW